MAKKRNLKMWVVMALFLVGMAPAIAAGGTIYVDASASPGGDGTSWGTAYKYLQDALAAAAADDEIWVAEGTYKPDENTANPGGTGSRTATFGLKNGVGIYGGFPSGGGAWANRDPSAYETILSGDLNGDDVGFTNNGENSYNVVTGSGIDGTAVLNGFTITAGNANDINNPYNRGGGMHNRNGSSPTVTNCTFSGNSVRWYGGGMYNQDSSNPTVTNCTFSGNSADGGGGMCNVNSSSPTVTNCTFSGNWTVGFALRGGAMYNWSNSNPMVTNCTFSGNTANYGGGMYNYVSSNPTLNNCTFSGNSADYHGGGMRNISGSPTLTNCTFSGNSAGYYGGGIYNDEYNGSGSNPTLTNCILWGNTALSGAQICNEGASSPTVTYSDVQGGWAGTGNINSNPLFADADLRLSAGSPCIDGGDNTAVPPDTADLDGDGDTGEPTPWDLDGNPRILYGIVDMGAYEAEYPGQRTLDVSSSSGGTVSEPGEGVFRYDPETVLQIIAEAEANYHFVEWTGIAVDAGKVANPGEASTTVTMDGNYTLVANFAIDQRTLTVSSTSGGIVAEPGEGSFQFGLGSFVPIIAEADPHCQFVEWTGTAVDAGSVADPNVASTTVTMDADYTLVANFVRPSAILHVDADASGANDGQSWATAYKYLQDALAVAVADDQIWVADGTYKPDANTANPEGTVERTATFQLINGVAIYGGFGGGESSLEERNPNTYETILSGDLDGNDVQVSDPCDLLTEPTRGENSYHVVTGSGTDATGVLDGFTITAGNANEPNSPNGKGGGMYNNSGSPTVVNCTFSRNSAVDVGGGMSNYNNSGPTVMNCTFSGNSAASDGGGMDNENSSPMVSNCVFIGNSATGDSWGGGMCNANESSPTVTNCTFSGNSAYAGGGMYNDEYDGSGSNPTLTNCILWGNTALSGAQIYCEGASFATVSYSDVQGGWPGMGNIDEDPLFIGLNGLDGIPGTADDEEGYVHLRGYSPCINAGDPGGDYSGQVDIDRQPRVAYGRVDMGADEVFPIAGDFEPDGDVDFADFARFANHWLLGVGD